MTTSSINATQPQQQNSQIVQDATEYTPVLENSSRNATTTKTYMAKPRSRLRSTGCKTCRQRKIKCDEQKPICKNCTKSHRTCLGYNVVKNYVFTEPENERSETRALDHARSLSYDPNQSLYMDPGGDMRRESTYSMTSDEQSIAFDNMMYEPVLQQPGPSYDRVRQRSGRSQSMDSLATAPMLTSPPQQRLLTEQHLEDFFFQRFITSVWLHSQVDAWQFYLPSALRNSSALYYAVISLSALYMSKIEPQSRAREYALGLYQGTLAQLQKAIYDPAQALRDETMMATIIVGLYELIDKPDLLSWTSHSRGTAELMKMRGTAAVRAGMGKMLFLTFRGYEVVRAILQCEETFVADPIWTNESSSGQTIRASHGLLTQTPETKNSPMQNMPDYAAVLFMLGGQVANLQALCVRVTRQEQQQQQQQQQEAELTSNAGSPRKQESKMTRDAILEQARILEQKLKLWRTSLPHAYNAPDFTPPLDLSAYTIGYQLCFYSAFLILLHRLVAKHVLQDFSRMHPESEVLARFILATTQYLTLTLTSVNLNVTWPIYMASISLVRLDEKKAAIDLLRSISREKGWRVADAALSAASLAAHKSRLREAAAEAAFYSGQSIGQGR